MAELNVNDITNTIQIIDACSQRGAFQGPELSSVGQVRERLVAFVEANRPPEAENVEPPVPPVDDESATSAETTVVDVNTSEVASVINDDEDE